MSDREILIESVDQWRAMLAHDRHWSDADIGPELLRLRVMVREFDRLVDAERRAAEAEALVERMVAAWPNYRAGVPHYLDGVLLDMHADRDGYVWTRTTGLYGGLELADRYPDRRSAILAAIGAGEGGAQGEGG